MKLFIRNIARTSTSRLLALLFVLLLPGHTLAAIVFDNVTAQTFSQNNTQTITHNLGAGTDRILLINTSTESGDQNTIQSITINGGSNVGVLVDQVRTTNGPGHRVEMWRVMEADLPATAGNINIQITWSGNVRPGIGVMSFTGVAQQAAEATATDTCTDCQTISENIDHSAGALIVSNVGNGDGGSNYQSHGTGQAEQWDQSPDSARHAGTYEIKAAAGTDSQSHRASNDVNRQAQVVAAFAPSNGTPPPPPPVGSICEGFENASTGDSGLPEGWTINAPNLDYAGRSMATAQTGSWSMFTRWDVVSVETQVVDMSGGGSVSYWVKRGFDSAMSEDPEQTGEGLLVQYWDGSAWQNLDPEIPGGTGDVFIRNITLPAAAQHPGFKLRFMQTGGDGSTGNGSIGYDYWHIDDVCMTPSKPAPLAYYTMDESSWGTVADSSGNGNNGTALNGAMPLDTDPVVSGTPGTCGYGDIPPNSTTNNPDTINTGIDVNSIGNNSGTIDFWYKSDANWVAGGDRMLLDASTSAGKYFHLTLRNDGSLVFGLEDNSPDDDARLITAANDFLADEWVHIAITWDLPADIMQIYLNGAVAAEYSPTVIPANPLPGAIGDTLGDLDTLYIGDNRSSYIVAGFMTANSANGSFDELRIYSSVLDTAAIIADKDATHPCPTSGSACGLLPGDNPVYGAGGINTDEDIRLNNGSTSFDVPEGNNLGNTITQTGTITTTSAALPDLDPATFPPNNAPGKIAAFTVDNSNSPYTFNSAVNGSYGTINVSSNRVANFTGGGPFHIDTLNLAANSTVNFAAGTYFINNLIMANATINITSDTVFLHIGNSFQVNSNNADVIVTSGSIGGLVVFLHTDAVFDADSDDLTFTGIIYGPNAGQITIGEDANFHGAIISGGQVVIEEDVNFLFTPADAAILAMITTCSSNLAGFTITHDDFGLNCAIENIAINAIDSNGIAYDAGGVVLTVNTNTGSGDWSVVTGTTGNLNNGLPDDGVASYTFASGETGVVLGLSYLQGTSTFTITGSATVNGTPVSASGASTITFTPESFIISSTPPPNPLITAPSFPAQTAGSNFTAHITAYGTQPNVAGCGVISGYAGNKNLSMWTEYLNPMPPAGSIAMSITDINNTLAIGNTEVNATPRIVNFTAGRATVVAKYKDVGLLRLAAKDANANPEDLPNGIRGSADIVFRPADLVLSNIMAPDPATPSNCTVNTTANPAATSPTGGILQAAGEPFCVTITSIDAEGDPTPSFGQEGENVLLTPAFSPDCTNCSHNPALRVSTVPSFTNGVATARYNWDEVGIITLTPSIADDGVDTEYLASGDVIGSTSGNIGRFTPFDFNASPNTPQFGEACDSFTYLEQPFLYTTAPVITITARSSNGDTTENYTSVWWKVTNAKLNSSGNLQYSIGGGYSLDTSMLPSPDPTIADNGTGTGTLTFNTGITGLAVSRPALPAAPFDAEIALSIEVIDDDDIIYIANPLAFGATTAGNGIAFTTSKEMRFGRLKLSNVFGSELLALNMPVLAEYFDGTSYILNTADNCTTRTDMPVDLTTDTWGDITLPEASYTGNLAENDTTPSIIGTLTAGADILTLTSPGAGNDGSVTVNLAAPIWLQFDWNGDGNYDNDPSALATFGIFHGNDATIYRRELY